MPTTSIAPRTSRKSWRLPQRVLAVVSFLGAGSLLGGCPIYDDNDPYYSTPASRGSCTGSSCACDSSFDCPNGYSCQAGSCVSTSPSCTSPSQCASGSVCGTDQRCHPGTCQTYGCPSGYACTLSGGSVSCVRSGATDAGADAAPAPECSADSTCSNKLGSGAKCLNGSCVAPKDQCSDATQCPGTAQCVDGACTPQCDATHPCPTGFSCDAKGVCAGNPTPCSSGTSCSGGNVCVSGHCVAPCSAGSCTGGLVCVGGGCVPNQKPQFVCQTEGVRDACAAGSLCLRHSCYIGCGGGDAGADAGASCLGADKFNVCKSVQTASGTYSVCGSTSNLGTECDPAQNKACTGGKVCIDGFCR